jgi:16S rRNA (cytosine967-C5)-methyltransferase
VKPAAEKTSHPQQPGRDARPGFAARQVATALLSAVLDEGRPLDGLLDVTGGYRPYGQLPPRDRRLTHAIVGTALRRHGEISVALARLIEKRPPRKAGALMRIIEIAAAQILFMGVPDHAAVSIALDQLEADRGDARHFKGLANAVLRRLARERESFPASDPRVNVPDWLQRRWSAAYGEETTRAIAAAHQIEPSLDLSVKRDPAGWAGKLGGIVLPTGSVRLVPAGMVEELAGYGDGEWWVQDAAVALPAKLFGEVGGRRVADLCAAPGGKTAALALAGARVTAVDISASRLDRLAANLARLKLSAELVRADVFAFEAAEPFDAVLLDAPCAATGTIRRHPDIPFLKHPEDVATLAELQAGMIERAVRVLKPGGVLVYCTCSLEPEEGEEQLARAVARHGLKNAPIAPAEIGGLAEAVTPAGAVRTLPSQLPNAEPRLSGLDGFFIMRLVKP